MTRAVDRMRKTGFGSYLVGDLPEGCRLCTEGAKLVLFVTGLCNRRCFYCPLSPERKGKDKVFANERPVVRPGDIIEEAMLMGALGTGMTGGDPLTVPKRALSYLELLKAEFGPGHHVHLYTGRSRLDRRLLKSLQSRGLDEIRVHAGPGHGSVMARAVEAGLRTGVEIPAIPGSLDEMSKVASLADRSGCSFLNVNELEMCPSTAEAFRSRGLPLISDESTAVAGSLETAIALAEYCEDKTSLSVHVCPARLKDAVQLKNRLGRMAERRRKPYELIDEDNLLVRAVITPRRRLGKEEMARVLEMLRRETRVSPELMEYIPGRNRIETSPDLAEELVEMLNSREFQVALTEEYPTWDRLETEVIPLN
jgi:pyruvate formate-lyase activating enzyme-like uncharacterized protein